MPAAPPLIEIRDAVVWRGGTRVFDGLDLILHAGQHAAILGPNGAGKTTLLKLISRELYPEAREEPAVRVMGRGLQVVGELRKRLGLVSHDLQHEYMDRVPLATAVVAGFAGSQSLAGVPFEPGPEHLARSREVIAEMGLEGLEDRPFRSLSTGQQRRCLLARALVHRPEALILDEPTAGLDPAGAFSFLARIRRLIREGTTIVLVTHHVNEIPPEIDRLVLLKAGRIVADGSKRQLLTAGRLADLYGVPVRVLESGGYFVALPG
jgi:iron complex transport system ATP-binding protein